MERIDDLQVNRLKLIQDTGLYRFTSDAVELANFAGTRCGRRVCDLGAGNGIVSVLLAGKFGKTVTAVELLEPSAALARRNAALNGLGNRLSVECASMQDYARQYRGKPFDAVVCNPPYRKADSGQKQESGPLRLARHEIAVTLGEVVRCAASLLSAGGKFFLVQQTQRLSEALCLCAAAGLEPKRLQILTPGPEKPPHLFLVQCARGGRPGLEIFPQRPVRAYGPE